MSVGGPFNGGWVVEGCVAGGWYTGVMTDIDLAVVALNAAVHSLSGIDSSRNTKDNVVDRAEVFLTWLQRQR